MDASLLTRRITFQRKLATSGFASAGKQAWGDDLAVWAEVQDVLPSRAERSGEGLTISRRPARIRIRYRAGITADMRILYGDRVLQIVSGPAELGRRDGLELMAEEYSTMGGGA